MDPIAIIVLIWLLCILSLIYLWWRTDKKLQSTTEILEQKTSDFVKLRKNHTESNYELRKKTAETDELKTKYAHIISIEHEINQLNKEVEDNRLRVEDVRSSYKEKRELLEKLEQQVAVYDERLAFAELGVYEPHFDFGDSETYKGEIKKVRDLQKAMISAKTATICPTDWTVGGSRSKGQTMINRQTRLTMRAFNNECEAAIANTRWHNVVAMEKRILNSAKQINNSNSSMKLVINEDYVAKKLDELHLTHEYRELLKVEKDKRAELARAEREEKKLLAEAEAAEREERKYQALLDKARKEAGVDESRIAELETALAEAHSTSERARAMAEMTKSGYVYIISNIGSFGGDIVKIGLTRRLDPDDRVRELGDASVPFGFDTHAIIYSEEAPALETSLHKAFEDRRVNAANTRKEFFRVSLEEVENAVMRLAPDANFFKDREAQEWHETLACRKQRLEKMQNATAEFPLDI